MPRIEYCYKKVDGDLKITCFTLGKEFRANAGMRCACDRIMKEMGASFGAREGRTPDTYLAVFPIDEKTISLRIPYSTPNLKAVLIEAITIMDVCDGPGV